MMILHHQSIGKLVFTIGAPDIGSWVTSIREIIEVLIRD